MNSIVLSDRRRGIRYRLSTLHWLLIFLLTIITALGVTTLYSVADGAWQPWALNHIIRYGIALSVLIAIGLTPLRFWMSLAYPAWFFSIGLLLLVPVIGETINGSTRWISLPGFQLQPSELAKIALIMALARYYHGLEFKRVSNPIWLVPPLVMIAIPTGLVFLQPDLGTALMIGATGVLVILLAGLSWRITVLGGIAGVFAAIGAIRMGLIKQYQIDRFTAFLNPDADPLGAGYHLTQSKIAIGSGGFTGKGFGHGTQSQLQFLPEMQTDFIFTIFAEEFGLVGTIGLLGLYLGVFIVCAGIARRAKSHFGRLLVMGVSLTFILYVLVNTGMVMGLAPVVGVPLPLVSYGGTVMMTVMAGFGLVCATWVCRDQDTLRTTTSYYERLG